MKYLVICLVLLTLALLLMLSAVSDLRAADKEQRILQLRSEATEAATLDCLQRIEKRQVFLLKTIGVREEDIPD